MTVALIVGGAGLNLVANRAAARDKSRAVRQAVGEQSRFRERASQAIEATLPQFSAGERARQLEGFEAEQIADLNRSIAAADERRERVAPNIEGRVSTDFATARADAARRTTEEAAALARLIGKVRAPTLLGQEESFARADLSRELGLIDNLARGSAGVSQLQIDAAGQPNPFLLAAGSALQGAGVGRLGAAKTPVPTTSRIPPVRPPHRGTGELVLR